MICLIHDALSLSSDGETAFCFSRVIQVTGTSDIGYHSRVAVTGPIEKDRQMFPSSTDPV